jgi:hypothetical protein
MDMKNSGKTTETHRRVLKLLPFPRKILKVQQNKEKYLER